MKKNFLLTVLSIFLISGTFLNAQNLVLNGDLEAWDDPNTPTSWTKAENITQATTPVHGGTYSAMHTSASSTKDFTQNVMTITGGETYAISYWYYDNDPEAKTRIWAYWLADESTTLPDNADILRPSVYSEDNPDWIQFSANLTAPPTATGFRFEVRVYHQDGINGGSVYYDDFSITGSAPAPEPTNYPTNFGAVADGISINLSWDDAIGEQLPSGYLIKASDVNNIAIPVDGTPEANDPDLSDGTGIMNINYGVQQYTFANLEPATTYYFKIFPYTNGGPNIDYKTDGTPPSANATTDDIAIINAEDFNDETLGTWSEYNVIGEQIWIPSSYSGEYFAKISGYSGGNNENEDWLISPALNFDNYVDEVLSFTSAMNYSGPPLELKISNDYDGVSDPNSATWANLEPEWSQGSYEWVGSGDVDVSSYSGSSVYIAFKYLSTIDESSTWEIDNILITGQSSSAPVIQSFSLITGFQFISSYVVEENMDMLIVLEDILNENLAYVRSSDGNMLRKIGPNWINGIGDWITTEGYLFKLEGEETFSLEGDQLPPDTPISLPSGFRFVSFLPISSIDAMTAFASIIGDDLLYIRNSQGGMLRKIGPNWINGIGDANPGEGYLVKMQNPGVLIYPSNDEKSSSNIINSKATHFTFNGGNAADNVYTIYVDGLEIGDEVAAYNGGVLVGAIKISSENKLLNALPVFNTLNDRQGYVQGNPINLKIYNSNSNEISNANFAMEILYNSYIENVYPAEDGEFSIVNITKGSISDTPKTLSIYPNPATENIKIQSQNDISRVMIINCTGQIIYDCTNNSKFMTINIESFKQGLYIIRVETTEGISTEKVTIN